MNDSKRGSADNADNVGNVGNADNANDSGNANVSDNANDLDNAGNADNAGSSGNIGSSDSVDSVGGAGGLGGFKSYLMGKLEQIEKDIFEYCIGGVNNEVVNLFTTAIENNVVSSTNTQQLAVLNTVMGECLVAMQNSDYLLLADLLRYRLTPVLGGGIEA